MPHLLTGRQEEYFLSLLQAGAYCQRLLFSAAQLSANHFVQLHIMEFGLQSPCVPVCIMDPNAGSGLIQAFMKIQ